MSEDIVTRLRDLRRDDWHETWENDVRAAMDLAADEIERLRKDVELLQDMRQEDNRLIEELRGST